MPMEGSVRRGTPPGGAGLGPAENLNLGAARQGPFLPSEKDKPALGEQQAPRRPRRTPDNRNETRQKLRGDELCGNCKAWHHVNRSQGVCRFGPKPEPKNEREWCLQFERLEQPAVAPSEPSKPKRKKSARKKSA